MAEGSFVNRVAELELEPAPLDPATILEGTPEVSELVLATSPDGRVGRGVWQITPGVIKDVEADELFVVISGRATVKVEGGKEARAGAGSRGGAAVGGSRRLAHSRDPAQGVPDH